MIELLEENTTILTAGSNTLPGTNKILSNKNILIINATIDNPTTTDQFISFKKMPDDLSLASNVKLENINTVNKNITTNFGLNKTEFSVGESLVGGIIGFTQGSIYTYDEVISNDLLYQQVYGNNLLYNELMATGSVFTGNGAGSGIGIKITLLHLG